jgi:chromosome segregation ATPase
MTKIVYLPKIKEMQMTALAERVSVLETKVEAIDEKIDEVKADIKEVHDGLNKTRDSLTDTLKEMRTESTNQHNELAGKITELENFRMKWTYMALGGLAVVGWITGHIDSISEFFK